MEAAAAQNAFVVRDYDKLKIIADPLRAQIVELLIAEPLNVRQVAERLGLVPTKLYYHFGLLERIGLIAVADTRLVANMVEKTYRATAPRIELDPALLNFRTDAGKENINTALVSTLDTTRDDVLRSLHARYAQLEHGAEARPRPVVVTRALSRLDDTRADAFRDRLLALFQEFEAADLAAAAGPPYLSYALTVAFYPSYYFEAGDERSAAPAATPP
jgi:DNA-binding transcriptional ArsR family regulator